jgi:YggT family protein
VLFPVFQLIDIVIDLYRWILIAYVILSWLVAFNVINSHNRAVYMIGDFLHRLTDPLLRPLRRFVPSVGGLDISPILLWLLLWFIQAELRQIAIRLL